MSVMEQFEDPWRPNFEAWATTGWIVGAAMTLTAATASPLPPIPFWTTASAMTAVGAVRAAQAVARQRGQKRIEGIQGLSFLDAEEIQEFARKEKDKDPDAHDPDTSQQLWVGYGFDWSTEAAQRAHSILRKGETKVVPKAGRTGGAWWIHGVQSEESLTKPMKLTAGHSLVSGTTGAGKTTLFKVLVEQAVARGEAVLIIDPKGDKDLRDGARDACIRAGDPDRFVFFHPAYPEESARLDPLRNWNRPTELASRVATLIPSESAGDPFQAFGWKTLNDIVNGLLEINEAPTLARLKRYIEESPEELVRLALAAHFDRHIADWKPRIQRYERKHSESQARAYTAFYREEAVHEAPNNDLEGLIGQFEHNREHLQKMIASLIPILNMLTAGGLNELISPDATDPNDSRPLTDNARVVARGQVLYVGLDSLADPTVGSAIGSMFLADLTAVAADRYNYGVGLRPVNVFVDESAEVLNDPTIQLLNKGRGARFRMHIAAQTFSDLAARLGDQNKANQVLGNCNNIYALRTMDADTQEYIVNKLPEFNYQELEVQYRQGSDTEKVDQYGAQYNETLQKEDMALFPQALLGRLPDLHYLGIFGDGRVVKGRFPVLTSKTKEAA